MPPMGEFIFQPYKDKIGRLHEFVNHDEPQSRYSVESSADDDDEYSPKEYASINSSSSEYDGNDDEEEDEEEPKKFNKQEQDDDVPNLFTNKGLQNLRNYDLHFEKKFNLPYHNEALKTSTLHI